MTLISSPVGKQILDDVTEDDLYSTFIYLACLRSDNAHSRAAIWGMTTKSQGILVSLTVELLLDTNMHIVQSPRDSGLAYQSNGYPYTRNAVRADA